MKEIEANELIETVCIMHMEVLKESQINNTTFKQCIDLRQFTNLTLREMNILNNVEPFKNLKDLVSNIHVWNESESVLNAFMRAIESEDTQIPMADMW